MSDIKDISLAPSGERKIAWVSRNMPVIGRIAADFERDKPLAGLKVTLSVHLEAKTAWLCRVLEKGGAEMHVNMLWWELSDKRIICYPGYFWRNVN